MSIVTEKYETSLKSYPTKFGKIELPAVNNGLSRKERAFLDLAMKVAQSSELDQRHGAVVVKAGKPVSLGVNKWRNRGLQMDKFENILTTHAEADALSRAGNVKGAVLYIARAGRNNEPLFSRPCRHCMAAIKAAGIKRIIYTTN